MNCNYDINVLNKYLNESKLKRTKHPLYDLYIWNYSEKVQYSKEWDSITLSCRGLVTDFDGNVVARSFSKFFNLEEISDTFKPIKSEPYKDNFKVYEKLDGSLGILFYYKNEWIFSSRGSFTSPQAKNLEKMLSDKIKKSEELFDKNLSYIFEIIYPENRIVVDYKDIETCIFLAAFEKNGNEVDIFSKMSTICQIVEEYKFKDPLSLKAENNSNKEGYVLVFDNGERIKIKFDNYVQLHRQVSNLTVKNAFEWIKSKEKIEKIVEGIPDEYHNWYKNIYKSVNNEFQRIVDDCKENYFLLFDIDRRVFAKNIQHYKYKSVLFKIYSIVYRSCLTNDEWNEQFYKFSNDIYNIIEKSNFYEQLKLKEIKNVNDKNLSEKYKNYENSDDLIINSKTKPSCIIFDIDGTLALNTSGRSPYNENRLLEDTLNMPVYEMYDIILQSKKYDIIICTGRTENSEMLTKEWFKRNNIVGYSDIYFRPNKNTSTDYLIKERMWRCISDKYNIVAIYDDRNQVVKHARKLGLTVFQVADGDF